MTELDVLDRFTDGRNDYLEPEIAEQLSSEHRETVDGKPRLDRRVQVAIRDAVLVVYCDAVRAP